MPRWSPTVLLSFVAWALLGHAAHATPSKGDSVAIVAIDIRGDAAPELSAQMQDSISAGLKEAGIRTITNAEVMKAIGKERQLINCSSSTCLGQVSKLVGTTRFLRGRVDASGAAYKIELELLDVAGEVENAVKQSCPVCTVTELSRIVKKHAKELVTTRPRKPVTVILTSRPEGAKVSVDGQSIGQTPYQGEIAPGKHRVTAIIPGYGEWEETIEIRAGEAQPQRFEMVLVRLATPKKPDTPGPVRARPYRHLKWVAGGASAAALVTGIVLLAIDGDGTCGASAPEQCPDLYDTQLGGLTSVGVGLGLAATSAWMFMRDRKDERGPHAVIVPRPGGAVGTVMLRF